jgi:hypothetical protein
MGFDVDLLTGCCADLQKQLDVFRVGLVHFPDNGRIGG